MYDTHIKDVTTITWHNLHFLLEYYTTEILSSVESVTVESKERDKASLVEIKSEVIATVKTLKAMHTVVEHYRSIAHHTKETTK